MSALYLNIIILLVIFIISLTRFKIQNTSFGFESGVFVLYFMFHLLISCVVLLPLNLIIYVYSKEIVYIYLALFYIVYIVLCFFSNTIKEEWYVYQIKNYKSNIQTLLKENINFELSFIDAYLSKNTITIKIKIESIDETKENLVRELICKNLKTKRTILLNLINK